MHTSYVMISALEICAAVFTGTLLIGSIIGRQYRELRDKLLLSLMLINIVMMLCDASIWRLRAGPGVSSAILLKCLAIIVDTLSFVTAALHAYYLTACVALKDAVTKRYAHTMLALCMIGAAVCLASMFSDVYLWFDGASILHYGVLYPYLILYAFVLMAMETVYPFFHVKSIGLGHAMLLVSYSMLLLLSSPLQTKLEAVPLLLANTLTLTIIYAVTHGEMGVRVAEQRKQLLEARLEAEQARISVMLSQIQPHFMFNVLNTIYHLCDMDASRAQQAVGDFSEYLCSNISALRRSELVPFEAELHTVKSYLALEKLRFEEELHVVYDIQSMDFMLPMLTVQPIVENAVKHGICKKPGGGTLEVAVRALEEAFEIIVTDDGVGFDPDAPMDDGREHIGICTTRQRLRRMCGGTLEMDSRPGVGTRAVIRIPRREQKEERL